MGRYAKDPRIDRKRALFNTKRDLLIVGALQHDGIATVSKGFMTVQPSDCLDMSQVAGNRNPNP